MSALITELLTGIAPFINDTTAIPFAFFGHSLGAWIAYAATQELQRRGGPLPVALFVSGVRAPQLAGVAHDPDGLEMSKLAAAAFWTAMESRYGKNPELQNADVRKFIRPVLQADFQISETYRRASEAPLPCPLFVYGGSEDCRYTRESLNMWKACTDESQVTVFKGGHHFLFKAEESKDAFLKDLRERVLFVLEGMKKKKNRSVLVDETTINIESVKISSSPSPSSSSPKLPISTTTNDEWEGASDTGATVASGSSYGLQLPPLKISKSGAATSKKMKLDTMTRDQVDGIDGGSASGSGSGGGTPAEKKGGWLSMSRCFC